MSFPLLLLRVIAEAYPKQHQLKAQKALKSLI